MRDACFGRCFLLFELLHLLGVRSGECDCRARGDQAENSDDDLGAKGVIHTMIMLWLLRLGNPKPIREFSLKMQVAFTRSGPRHDLGWPPDGGRKVGRPNTGSGRYRRDADTKN